MKWKSILLPVISGLLTVAGVSAAEQNICPEITKGWEPQFNAIYVPDEGHGDFGCLQIKRSKNVSPDQGWLSPAMKLDGSMKQLRLSAWMKCNSVSLGDNKSDETYNASLSLQFFGKDGKQIGPDHSMIHVCYSVRRGWKFQENDIAVPAGADTVKIRFHFLRNSVGIAWASDIRLRVVEQSGTASVKQMEDTSDKPLFSGRNATGKLPFWLNTKKFTQIFDVGDPLTFYVTYRPGNELPKDAVLRYSVRDIHGRQVEKGELALTGKNDQFTLAHPEKIVPDVYHKINAKIYTGKQLWAEDMTPFGIIRQREFDPKSEPEIFELHGMDMLQIRMGVRRIYLIGHNPSDKELAKAKELKEKYGLKIYTNGLIVTTSWNFKGKDPNRKNYFFKTTEEQFRKDVRVQLERYKGIVDYVGLMGELRVPERGVAGGWEEMGGAEKFAEDQVQLMRIVKEEIANVAPGMKACAGGYFWPGFDLLIEKGIAEAADVIMFHRFCDPAETYSGLAQVHREFAKYGKKTPELWIDEAYTNGDSEFQVPQQYAAYIAHGVKTGDWHFYNTDMGVPDAKDALTRKFRDKGHITLAYPSLFTYNVMVGQLSGLKFIRSVFPENSDTIAYLYEKKGTDQLVLVSWTRPNVTGKTLKIRTGVSGEAVITGMRGDSVKLSAANGEFYTGVSPLPQYIVFSGRKADISLSSQPLVPGINEFPAVTGLDNTFDFGKTDIPSLKELSMQLVMPEGWTSRYQGQGTFTVQPEPTLQYGQVCDGRVLWLKDGKAVAQHPVKVTVKPPLALDCTSFLENGKDILRISIHNYGPAKDVKLNVENHVTASAYPEKTVQNLALPGSKETVVDLPLNCRRTPDRYPVILTLTDKDGVYLTSLKKEISVFGIPYGTTKEKPTAALDSPFWKNVKPVVMDSEIWLDANEVYNTHPHFYMPEQNDGTWKNKDDFNVKFYQQWDENTYYFRAVVRDPEHINNFTNVKLWCGDAIQMALRDPDNRSGTAGFMFGINRDKKVQAWRYSGNDFNGVGDVALPIAVKRYEDQKLTVYEVYIPKKEMDPMKLVPNRTIGITSVFVNRINPIGNDPMVMRFGYSIYCGGNDGGDFPVRLDPPVSK